MTRYSSTMSEAYKKVIYRDSISERDLTDTEEKRREEIAKDLPDQEFKDRYGARWKSVKMATATKMAKKESLDEGVRWKVKIEGLPPVYMDAGSASEVRTKLRKLVKQPDMVQDIDRVTDTQMKKDLRDRLAGKDKEEIEEAREKPARQLLNPNREEMVVKKNTVIVIDKKDLDKYLKRGWELAEETEIEEVGLDEEVADLFVQDKVGSNHQVQIALKIKGLAKKLGLRTGSVGNQVRVMGPKKIVTQFMGSILGKSSLGNPTEKGASDSQTNRELKKQLREEETLDEAKFEIVYVKKVRGKDELYSKTIDARNEDDAENKAIKKWKIKADDIRTVAKEGLDEAIPKSSIYGHVHKGKVIAVGSKSDMNKSAKKKGKIVYPPSPNFRQSKKQDTNYVINSPGVKVGDTPKTFKEEVELDEQFDYVLLDKDNKIVGRYSGKDAKRNAEMGKRSAHLPPMRIPKNDVKKMKVYPIRPTDKKKIGDTVLAIGEAKLIDKPTGEVLKTGSKKEMETERKRNRDELQVKEWFKSKGIDVTIRKLDDATQAYVRLGKIIPNEIREDLVKIQYGKLPEDIKNTNNIVYGNFKENSITMNNEFWKKVFEARKDDPSQEQDTNIIMQLRKSVSLRGMKDVEFEDGKKVKVKPAEAAAVMDKFNSYRTTDQKLKFQQKIAKSYDDLLSALKEK